MPKPRPLLRLKANMVLAGLSQRQLSSLAKVEYCRVSEILNGHRNDAVSLAKITRVIDEHMQREGVVA